MSRRRNQLFEGVRYDRVSKGGGTIEDTNEVRSPKVFTFRKIFNRYLNDSSRSVRISCSNRFMGDLSSKSNLFSRLQSAALSSNRASCLPTGSLVDSNMATAGGCPQLSSAAPELFRRTIWSERTIPNSELLPKAWETKPKSSVILCPGSATIIQQ